jgi:hypothetical protein
MKPDFYSLTLQPGAHRKGIVDIKLAAKDWVVGEIEIDFNTGKVINAVELIDSKAWLAIQFTPKSYQLTEKPKTNKSGEYFEITIKGSLNRLTAISQQTLHNMKGFELVVIAMDKQKVKKLIGNKEHGMILNFEHDHSNDTQSVDLSFSFDSEFAAPFYTPPNSSTSGNTLTTEDGDILITEDGNQIEEE